MSEHPILFSAPMVRAILSGSKTQTRRVLKPQPAVDERDGLLWWKWSKNHGAASVVPGETSDLWLEHLGWAPGDRLWVREGCASVPASAYRCSEGVAQTVNPSDRTEAAIYRAGFDRSRGGIRWRSPIHMPRWASRITLAVETVRVERLQDISEGDARAEGCFFTDYGRNCFHQGGPPCDPGDCPAPDEHHPQRNGWMWDATTSADECLGSARSAFGNLWEKIQGADAWNGNPWVSVTTFRRVEA